ncbi:MAG TPA: lipid-binding SYLF domain-containing protein [Kiloniellales bacterium]
MSALSALHNPLQRVWLASLVVASALILMTLSSARAATEPEELVEKAALTVEKLMVDPNLPELRHYIERAQGVLIIPQLVKGGLIIGGEGGSGVLLVKGSDGSWSSPAFYTLGGASFGLQIGGEMSEVVFTIMNDGAIDALIRHQFKLGADASVAVGPVGKGVEASTTSNLSDDIYAFSKSVGLFGGGVLEGAAIVKRTAWNELYYAAGADPQKILIDRKYFNPHADRLRASLPN